MMSNDLLMQMTYHWQFERKSILYIRIKNFPERTTFSGFFKFSVLECIFYLRDKKENQKEKPYNF